MEKAQDSWDSFIQGTAYVRLTAEPIAAEPIAEQNQSSQLSSQQAIDHASS